MRRLFCALSLFATVSFGARSQEATAPSPTEQLGILAAMIKPGDWLEVTDEVNFTVDHVLPNVVGNGLSPITEFTDRALFDPKHRMVHVMGCARGGAVGTDYECGDGNNNDAGYSYYDLVANTWTRDTSHAVNTAPHAYDHATLDDDGNLYFWENIETNGHVLQMRTGGPGGRWSTIPQGGGAWCPSCALEFFPERRSLVFIDGGNDVNRPKGGPTFFPKIIERRRNGSWTPTTITSTPSEFIGYLANFSRYSPQRQLIYFGGGQADNAGVGTRILWTYDAAGKLERQEDAPSGLQLGTLGSSGKQAINPCNGNLLALDNTPKDVWEFDPTSTPDGTWTNVGMHPLTTDDGNQLLAVLATVDDYDVVMVVSYNGGGEVWLYKPSGCA